MSGKAEKIITMPEEQKKRTFRSKEERISEIDKKIEYHKELIKVLETKKAKITNSKRGTGRTKTLKRLISDAKLSDAELIEVMGLGDEEKIRARLGEIIEEKNNKAEAKAEG